MAPAICAAERVVVPLNTRCSIRWEMPPRSSGSTREPVSTQMPTATERTCGIASVTMRMPFGSRSLRQVTRGTRSRSGTRPGRGDRELFAVRHGGLVSQRALPRQADLAVRIDLDDLDRDCVALGEHVGHGADPILGDLGD